MASQGKRKEKGIITEYDTQLKEIRSQLADQLKCLDTQVEFRSQCLQDLSDFFRRKAEIELEYSRGLEKLAERFSSKIRNAKEHQGFRKDQNLLSPVNCWYLILDQTRRESKDHGALSEIYTSNLILRLSHICEDVTRLSKKSKEIGIQMQEELFKVTNELQTAMKTYHNYHLESINAEGKLKEVEKLEEKQMGKSTEQGAGQLGTDSKAQRRGSLRKIEKMKEKRREKYLENQLKCTKARNDYLLNLAVANAALSNYFIQDLSQLIDYWDLGFHSSLSRTLRTYLRAETSVETSRCEGLNIIEVAVDSLDPQSDKTKIMDINHTAFCLPNKFGFLAHDQDQVCEVRTESALYQELLTRFQNLQTTLVTARLETEEINKTLKATVQALQDLVTTEDYDIPDIFQSSRSTESVKSVGSGSDSASNKANIAKRRSNQQDTETYYFTKVKEYVAGCNRITKLDAKYKLLKPAIEKGVVEDEKTSRLPSTLGRSQRQRKPRPCSQYNQKLFNGELDIFIQSSGQPIPLVVVSCIRFINLYGLHHEGIFRIPGSQSEVNDIRNAFERGEDPLDTMNEHNIDSVAGVLKLYFRGLSKPFFPMDAFGDFLACVETVNLLERAYKIKKVLGTLQQSIVVVMRYLFAFLNHLSQYSDENMMDAYNLAVCFGPTLITVPEDQDPVSCQAQVNELIKTVIVHHEKIFPRCKELEGPVYEKCMTEEESYCDSLQNEPIIEECEHVEHDTISESHASEDEAQAAEFQAVAKFDYVARSANELSLKKGAPLVVFEKMSEVWWRGQIGGLKGLVPHKYIEVMDTADGQLETPSEEGTDSSRLSVLSDSDSEPVLRKRSGSSPVRRIASLFEDSPVRIPACHTSPQKLLLPRPPAAHLETEERQSLASGIQERRNTLDVMQLTHSPMSARAAGGKLDRQQSDKPISELNKNMVKNMDSVFRELLLVSKRPKSSSEEPQEPGRVATSSVSRSSSGASEKPPNKQGAPSKTGMKARAAALFKSAGGSAADGTPKVTS